MNKPRLDTDVHPLSEFRAKAARLIAHAQKTGRPMVITQNGKASAVMLSASAWEDLQEDLALIRARAKAEEDLKHGHTLSKSQARKIMQTVLKVQRPLE
jgi:prevent-host-death family protein